MFPIWGAAILFPEKSSAVIISELGWTIKLAPPLAAPDSITNSLSDFKKPFIAGPGPTYARSIERENMDSITWGPLSNNFVSTISFGKISDSIPMIGIA